MRLLMPILATLLTTATAAPDGSTSSTPPATEPPRQTTADPHELAPVVDRSELVAQSKSAIEKGFGFLLRTQNADGSWGSHDPKTGNLKDFGFKTTNRGSQDGVRIACTAICANALLEKRDRSEAESEALERAITVLLGTERFAYHVGEAFNTWGYGYKLDFLTRYLETPAGEARREAIEAAAAVCIAGLRRFQQADGGWNYYAGPMGDGESMSFNTGNFAFALTRAKALGLEVPDGMAGDAVKLLKRMRTAKGGFVYDARFLHDPRSVNELSAGSRTVICALALHEAGVYDDDDLRSAMDVFNEGENYLEDGRKLIQPHAAVHQISGYFFFYGYNYASEMAMRLGDSIPDVRWDRFAWTMVRTQEKNGAWWDTAAADYGDKWGTGFALSTLMRYVDWVESNGTEGAE